ncbi:hypothetical protein PhaeoP23_03986 (plasmid) [Phaeobacter piscinae]|uniref:Uncharacterized protein n=1 Tax=Phaeobacter piscinae TaxID=1580596 RepID=A0ABN5DWX5_9RHOB|nr:hypothetical protein PhaeoP36_04064 [Phaeobacter piscinae]AUQ88660.1 hypothetical protein PhaeoP42_04065 [Phaeobacter piscinae]AUQ92659.1 hypothetical protein PhaeoP24_04101 [Phaeobacter inhibens]AUR26465.1 hypothetical protein PhaeoP23_03986 [Phaeobacter piscinae]
MKRPDDLNATVLDILQDDKAAEIIRTYNSLSIAERRARFHQARSAIYPGRCSQNAGNQNKS